MYLWCRSQLELDVLRQLQLSHPRDGVGMGLWNELRGVNVDRAYSDEASGESRSYEFIF